MVQLSVGLYVVGAHVPVTKIRGSRCDRSSIFMSLLTGMGTVGGRPKPVEVGEGTCCTLLCTQCTLRTLNFGP